MAVAFSRVQQSITNLKGTQHKKHVYVDGFACSVAATIAMCGDKIIMPRNAMMMIHNAWNIVAGNSAQLRKAADDLDTINEGNRQAYLQKAGDKITEDKLVELLDGETWLTAEQCIEYGFADEYAEQEADMSKAKQLLQKVNKTFEQQLSYNKAISAQLKQLAEDMKEPEPTPEPKELTPEPKQNTPKKFNDGIIPLKRKGEIK